MTALYVHYEANGRICQASTQPSEPSSGLYQAEVNHPDLDLRGYMIDAGALLKLPDQPTRDHVFDYDAREWKDPRPLEVIKDLKWASIKASRTAAEFGAFTYNGMLFDGDVDAQRRLAGYISVSKSALASSQPFEAEFILADNTVVTLSASDFVGIELAKVQSVAEAFAHATGLRLQIEAATTRAEVEAVVW